MTVWFTTILVLGMGLLATLLCLGVVLGLARGVMSLPRVLWRLALHRRPDTHGSARLATRDDLGEWLSGAPGGLVLGEWDGEVVRDHSEAHLLAVGSSGTGKSRSVMACTVRDFDGAVLCLDLKSELYHLTADDRARHGVVHRWAPGQPDSIALNVMDLVRWGTDHETGDAQRLAAALLLPDPTQDGMPGRLEAQALLTAMFLHHRRRPETRHLAGLLQWMSSAPMPQRLEDLQRETHAVCRAQAITMAGRSDRQRALVWNAALTSLQLFYDAQLARCTDHSDVDLTRLPSATRQTSVFLCVSEGDLLRLRPLLRALFEMLVGRLCDHPPGSQRHTLLLALDEFPQLGQMPTVALSLNYLRGFKVRCVLTTQSLTVLRDVYGPSETVSGLCALWWYGGSSDPRTLQVISAAVGVTTVSRLSDVSAQHWWSKYTAALGSELHSPRPLLTADEVGRLPRHEALILREGSHPARLTKYGQSPAVPSTLPMGRVAKVRVLVAINVAVVVIGLMAWYVIPSGVNAPRQEQAREMGWGTHTSLAEYERLAQARIEAEAHQATTTQAHAWARQRRDGWREPTPLEEMHLRQPAPGWGVWKVEMGLHAQWMRLSLESRLTSAASCEAARQATVDVWHQGIASKPAASWRPTTAGFVSLAGGKQARETWFLCAPTSPES